VVVTAAELTDSVTTDVLLPAAAIGTGVSVATLAAVLPLAGLTSGVSVTGFASGLLTLLLLIWNAFLEWLGLRKRRYPWGTVFDVRTDQPLELAIVRLKTPEGKLLETRVTDRMGRYSFLAEPGRYVFEVTKAGYTSVISAPGSRWQPVWDGQPFAIAERSHAIEINLALRQTDRRSHLTVGRFLQSLHRPALLVTLPLGLWNYAVTPSWGTAAVVLITGLLILGEWLLLAPRGYGIVTDARQHPLQGVVLRLLRAEDSKVLATAVTDVHGRYTFLARPGHYLLTLATPHLTPPDWMVNKEVIQVARGAGQIIDRRVLVRPAVADRGHLAQQREHGA
jgi:hypothetical protein